MAERANTDKKAEWGNFPASPECGQWETLLVDALDGLLGPEDEAVFTSHMATCAPCTAMFEQARRGQEWLEFLAPEPAVPAHLLDRILAETGHGKQEIGKLAVAGGADVLSMPPVWQRPGFSARLRRFAEPRLLMTAAMAFFSIALTLSMTGVRISGMKMADLRPAVVRSALEKRIMTASTPLIRYYDHLRFVYEVESTMRELRRNSETQPDQQNDKQGKPSGTPQGSGESHKKDGGSQLNPGQTPGQPQQQTVNPPVSSWGGGVEETRFQVPRFNQSKGLTTTLTEVSSRAADASFKTASSRAGWLKASVSAMPEWSFRCIA